MPEFVTACPRNCYSTCTLKVRVEDGRVREIAAHPGNLATPEGPCLKGLAYVERQVSPDRILHPLRRRADGGFARVSWDEALDEIAARLGAVRDESGPQALLYYSASGTKGLLNGLGLEFWRLWGGCTTTYGDLCWPAGLEATRLALGANQHNAPWDLANARLVVLWGKNAAETNVHQVAHLDAARRAGAKVAVVDPRRTETADRADLLLQPRPGTDAALALAVARRVIDRGGVDGDFVARHVKGYDAFAARAREWTVARAAEICDLPEAGIEALADLLASIRPATIAAGFGMQRYTNSGQTMRCLIALVAITGNLGRPGAGWQFANLQSSIFDAVPDPFAFYPPERPDGVVRVSVSTARLGADLLAAQAPPLRAAWVERGNPLSQNPATPEVREAFRALDFRVVVEQFLTDTAREADLVLPAKTLFEQSDVIGAYWHPYVQLKQKLVDPPGEVRPETEIYRALAPRLGIAAGDFAARFPGPADADLDAWLEARLAPFPELSLARLREGPVLAPGCEKVAFADGAYPTPSGKIELASEEAAARWGVDPLPGYTEPAEAGPATGDFPLLLMTPNTKNRIHSQFGNLAMIRALGEGPFCDLHPDDAAARGIAAGDRVRVFNARGECFAPARLDRGLRPGCCAITNGWWAADGAAVNLTSAGRETDLGYGAAFHENRVQAEKAP